MKTVYKVTLAPDTENAFQSLHLYDPGAIIDIVNLDDQGREHYEIHTQYDLSRFLSGDGVEEIHEYHTRNPRYNDLIDDADFITCEICNQPVDFFDSWLETDTGIACADCVRDAEE